MFDALSALVDAAVTEDVYRLPGWLFGRGMEDARIDAARGAMTLDAVLALHPAADALGIPEEIELLADDFLFPLMPFEDEIEVLRSGAEAFELRQDGIFTAYADVEGVVGKRGKRPGFGLKIEPIRLAALRMKKDEGMAAPGEFVAQLEIAPDAAINLDVREERGDLHGRN